MFIRLRPPSISRRFSRRIFPKYLATTAVSASPYEEFDIVIVGGGPAGLALAGALSTSRIIRDSIRIALVEAGNLNNIKGWTLPAGEYSNRVSSLTNTSYAFLKDIGAWDFVEVGRTCPVEHMEVWDGISDARIDFDAAEMGSMYQHARMACLTENLNLQRALLCRLESSPTVDLIQQTKVISITRDSERYDAWPIVNLDIGRCLRAKLLVGADGFNSPVRGYAQIPSFGWSYDAQGIVATLIHRPKSVLQGHNRTAYQRFLPTGPIAFLPLAPTVSSLVWSMKPHIAEALQGCDPLVLVSMVNAAFRLPYTSLQYLYNRILLAHASGKPVGVYQLREEISWQEKSHGIEQHSAFSSVASSLSITGAVVMPEDSELVPPLVVSIQDGSLASFPLRFSHTEAYIGKPPVARTVLIGDAAHSIHPLAGQGLNLGLGDVECLRNCIHNSILRGGDIGSFITLQPYAQERYLANHQTMSAVDKLHKLYCTDSEFVVWARSVGIEVVNELDWLKAAIMRNAGADGRKKGDSSSWEVVAKGVDILSGVTRIIRGVGSCR